MNHERSPSSYQAANQAPVQRSGRPVVIRPMQPLEGTNQNIRVDAAQPQFSGAPHRRTERLEEYVSWLQQQTQQQLSQPIAESSTRPTPESTPVRKGVELSPVARSTNPKALQDDRSFSQSAPMPQPQPTQKTARPIIEFVKKPNEPKQFRHDPRHAQPEAKFSPPPKTPTDQFQLESDLERILRKLESAEEQAKQLSSSTESSAETANLQTAFLPKPVRKVLPAEFAQPYPEDAATRNGNASTARSSAETLTKAEIIQTISAAIASALTNQAEPIIEARIKARLQELQLELVPDTEAVYESGINATPRVDRPDISGSSRDLAASGTRRFSGSTEIPVHVAAWDVGEFRWPKVTDQMITLGAAAIGQLTSTLLDTLVGTRRRVAVTAPDRRAGTTSIAISLARWVAGQGGRVLLVDADLAHPEMSSLVGLGTGISWLNALRDPKLLQTPSEHIIRSQKSPICVMPLVPTVGGANADRGRTGAHRLDQLGRLLDPVTFDFDLILLDVGPSSQILSELTLGSHLVDTALIVHQDKGYKVNQVQNQLRALEVEQFVFAQNASSETRSQVA